MKIEFTITTPDETRRYIREYEPTTPEYAIADDAFAEAVKFLNAHNFTTFDDVDYTYRKISDPFDEDINNYECDCEQ